MENMVEMSIKNKQEMLEEAMDGVVGVTAVDGVVQEMPTP